MLESFAVYFLVVLPIFYIGGPNGVREYLSIIGASLYWMVALGCHVLSGADIFLPSMPIMLFGLWCFLSVFWSGAKENSIFDCLMILSCLTAFTVVQQINMELALLLCFLPSPGIATTLLYDEYHYRLQLKAGTNKDRPGGIFGNCNHSGVYLAINVLVGAWLAQQISLWFIPFVIITICAAFYSRSRNAQTSMLVGTVAIFLFAEQWLIFGIMFMAGLVVLWKIKRHTGDRDVIAKKAFSLIRQKPFYGWGLNTFRIEHCYFNPPYQTHRVHNDYLEFWSDIGFVGLFFLYLIYSNINWSFSPLLSAQVIIVLWSALWFFPFREVHTAMPIWGLLAVLIPVGQFSITPLIGVLLLALPYIIWTYIGRRIIALYWYATGSRQKTKEDQYAHVLNAVKYDENSVYLSRGAYLAAVNKDPNMAWDLCARALYQFDGQVTLISMYDQISRAALMMGAVALSDYFNKKSLKLDKEFISSVQFSQKIAEIKTKMMGDQSCQVTSVS